MTTYIAGPMTGHPDFNYPAFAYAATVLRAKGIDARSPHEIDNEGQEQSWQWYMRRALRMLLECDAITLLPGWETSRGACCERSVAEALGMTITEWAGSTS